MPKVLELFSGIGGMRAGLTEGFDPSVNLSFTSVDMNEFCNDVYYKSYGDKPLNRDICSIPLNWFEDLGADIWTMSPPCQPYTRQGNQKDILDDRAEPLTYLTNQILGKLHNVPKIIILENVKNFEISDSYNRLVQVLHQRGYKMRGFLLNPLYMGFPNSRLRFFLIASLSNDSFPPNESPRVNIQTNDPIQCPDFDQLPSTNTIGVRRIGEFLCRSHRLGDFLVPKKLLEKKAAFCFDIVSSESTQCVCFTRAYTKYIDGTGSVLLTEVAEQASGMDEKFRPVFSGIESMAELYGKLRYFCPAEAARLNGFKVGKISGGLSFPPDCSGGKQFCRAVGNSLNPNVVAYLVRHHLE